MCVHVYDKQACAHVLGEGGWAGKHKHKESDEKMKVLSSKHDVTIDTWKSELRLLEGDAHETRGEGELGSAQDKTRRHMRRIQYGAESGWWYSCL